MLDECARRFEICGFKSLCEAVVNKSEIMTSLLPPPRLGKKARQVHCRSQLKSERRLRSSNFNRIGQAFDRRVSAVLRRQNTSLYAYNLGQFHFDSTIDREVLRFVYCSGRLTKASRLPKPFS